LTSDGVITGTPSYIAPEVALGGRTLDARVDLYGPVDASPYGAKAPIPMAKREPAGRAK
jgi:hypothetical protein